MLRRASVWLGVAGALALGACSRDSASEARVSSPAPAASAAPVSTPTLDAGAARDRAQRAAALPRESVLRLALISAQPAEAVARYGALVDWLAARAGYPAGDLVVHDSSELVIGQLCDGSADLLLESVYPVVVSMLGCRTVPVAVAAKGNSYRYHATIIVRSDSSLTSLTDLGGRDILFEEPSSTSAYLVPRSMLESAGLIVEPYDQASRPGAVRYRFGREKLNLVGWVVHGLAAAAAISDQDLQGFPDAELRVLARSEPLPRQAVALSPRLSEAARERVRVALLEAAEGGGRAALETADTAGFQPLTADDHAFFAEMQRLLARAEKAP